MTKSIGKLSATLTANAQPFVRALDLSKNSLAAYGAHQKKEREKLLSTEKGWASEMGRLLKERAAAEQEEAKRREQSAQGWRTWALGVGKAAVSAVTSFGTSLRSGLTDLIKTDDQARELGVSVLDMRASMILAAGAEQEMASALSSIQGKLLAVGTGSAAAANDLASLAAASGLSVQALRAGGALQVIDALAAIRDRTQQTTLAFQLLGSSAGPILSRLREGGAAAARDQASRMGLGAHAGDLESVRKVDRAIRDIGTVGAGAFNQALLGIAPIGAELTTLFDGVKLNLTFIKPLVIDIAEGVTKFGAAVATVASDTDLLSGAFASLGKTMEAGALRFKAAMLEAIDEVIKAMTPLRGTFLGGVAGGALSGVRVGGADLSGAARRARGAADAASESATDMWGGMMRAVRGGPLWQAVDGFFGNVRKRAEDTGKATEKAFAPLISGQLVTRFNSMRDSLKSPAVAFRESMDDIQAMRKGGLFGGDQGLAGLMAFKALGDLRSATGMPATPSLAGAAEANTREAYSAAAQYKMLGKRESVQDEIKRLLELAKEQNERKIQATKEVVEELKKNREAEAELEIG